MSKICERCKIDYTGTRWVDTHRCLGTSTPSVADLLVYLGAEVDERGCLIPTQNFKALGYKNAYRALPQPAQRIIGEYYAHRAIYRLATGHEVPVDLDVGHECGKDFENPSCVNPAHLRACTRKENHAHMNPATRSRIAAAGGLVSPTKFKPGHVPWNKSKENSG